MDKKNAEFFFFFRVNYILVLKQQAGQLLDMALSKNPFVLKAKDRVELHTELHTFSRLLQEMKKNFLLRVVLL